MKNFSVKRFMAYLLLIVMVVGVLPAQLFHLRFEINAEGDEPIYVLAGSDFQADSGDAAGSANIEAIIAQIKAAGYSKMDGFLFAGDYSVNATKTSNVNALKDTILNAGLGLTASDMVLVQGNHDNSNSYSGAEAGLVGSVLNNGGAADKDGYGVYVINEKDYPWRGGSESTVMQTANALDKYLDEKVAAEYDEPIFIVSHLPLNYNMRTLEGDGMYANYIFKALDDGAKAGLNIIYMFGHDHSNGWDDYLGGAAIYLEKGDKINIAQASRTEWKEETLSFTYMNAGYVGYYRNVNTGSETDLTMTVFEITEDDVTVKRFSASGLHDLKSAGVTNSYKNESGYEPNTEVIKSPQIIKLQKFITGETFTSNGVSVTAPNLTGLNVMKIFGTADTVKYSTTQFSSYASYDINPVGYTQGDEAKVTITLDAADGFDPTRPVLVYDKSANKYTTASIANGKVTFIAEHFSVYDIAQIKSVVIEVPVVSAGPAERTYTRVTSLSGLVSGDQYLIIHNGQNDFMIPVIVSSDTRIGYDLVKAPSGLGSETLSGDYQAYEWKFESVSGGWHIGSSAGYMYFEAAGDRHAAKLGTTAHTMVISGTANNFTFKNATYSNGSFVLNYNGTGDLINGYASGPAPFYIYRLTSEGTGGPTVTTGNNGWVQLSAPVSGAGADDVKPSGDSWVTLTQPSSGETIFRLTDTLVAGQSYVIVSRNTAGNGTATNANGNNINSISVEVLSDSKGAYIKAPATTAQWEFTSNKLQNVSRDRYLRGRNSALALTNDSGASYTTWSYLADSYGLRAQSGSSYRYMTSVTGTSTRNSNTNRVYLYVEDTLAPTLGLYAYLDGELSYKTTGMTVEQVLQTVKNGVDAYFYEGSARPGIAVSGTKQDDSLLTWTLDPNYNPNVPGDYAVTVSYDGKVIGVVEAVVTAEDKNGTWYKAEGSLTYPVTVGTTAEEALALVMNGIDGYKYEGMSAPGASVTGTRVEDSELTWTLDSAYADGTAHGEYAVTIKKDGKTLAVAKVIVPEGTLNYTVTIDSVTGEVNRGSSHNKAVGSVLTVTDENGNVTTVPVTVGMLKKADGTSISTTEAGTLTDLDVYYTINGMSYKVFEDYTLNVIGKAGNDYPEYPNEGAVKVNKVAIYTDEAFRKTGVAQVELSVSGVPLKKGADVVVMLDLSSSMHSNSVTVDGVTKTRLQILRESLTQLLTQLQTTDADGDPMDINIAIADFNRYYIDSDSPYYINSNDHLAGGSIRTNASGTNKVYTQNGDSSFMSVHDITANAFETTTTSNKYYLGYASGTNYDYAFDKVYDLAKEAKDASDAAGEERDLFVIFMSDGAPFQYNYYSADSDETYWNNWLQGSLTDSMFSSSADKSYYNPEGKHWMAEAIKGEPGTAYPVIRKNNEADIDGDTWIEVDGLGAKMYSIGFCLADDKDVTVTSMDTVIRNLASSEEYYFRAENAAELSHAFTRIGRDIAYAAYNARFEDQMGDAFDLQMTSSVTREVDGVPVSLGFTPAIIVKQYAIYTKAEADEIPEGTPGDDVTLSMIGLRKNQDPTILEIVCFSADGQKAYSSVIDADGDGIFGITTGIDPETGYATYTPVDEGDNILAADGLIYAKSFLFNTDTEREITATGTTVSVQPETFYWKVGTVQQDELAISYYVYLTDTMEGERAPGSYATNNFAILYYDNYLGNPCEMHTVSPMLAWKQANVSYAFYLVNEDGEVIVDRASGATGTFANKVPVTRPVVYDYCYLNTESTIAARTLSVTESTVLPDGYSVYDDAASYSILVLSDSEDVKAGWEITKSSNVSTSTTYVTGFSSTVQYSNDLSVHEGTYDYTHTIVWFAVVWTPTAIPDQVVVDYGLPVDISVLGNDLFENGAKLNGLGTSRPSSAMTDEKYSLVPAENFASKIDLNFGTAELKDTKVRYTPKSMEMTSYDRFVYEVQYVINGETQYYYGDVTVIPATIIYYEETFVTFENGSTVQVGSNGKLMEGSAVKVEDGAQFGAWTQVGTMLSGVTQDEDRPGKESLGTIDKDNIYGYDGVNTEITEYSLGTAMQVIVHNSEKAADGSYTTTGYNGYAPKATFSFTGTGFDIISLTDSDSGMIRVTVTDKDGNKVYSQMITSYYGMSYDEETGEWTSVENAEGQDTIWQVPVIKKTDLAYGTYTVEIQVVYMTFFDQDNGGTGNGNYYFVLDSVRVYDPANGGAEDNDTVIEDAYKADGETNPHYLMIKDAILDAATADTLYTTGAAGNGVVFIDGIPETNKVNDYTNPGPNNEAYLAQGQSISFKLKANATPLDVQIGLKVAYGGSANVQLTYTAANGKSESKVRTFKTTTDMYYSIASYLGFVSENQQSDSGVAWTSGTITLTNTSNAIISLTNVKATFKNANYRVDGGTFEQASAPVQRSLFSFLSASAIPEVESAESGVEKTVPVSFTFLADAEVIEAAGAVMNDLYAPEPVVFVPAYLKSVVDSAWFGYETIRIVTSHDVASVTVNGVAAEKLTYTGSKHANLVKKLMDVAEKSAKKDLVAENYDVWTVSMKRATEYSIVAYDENGAASDASVAQSSAKKIFDRTETYSIMEDLAKQEFAPDEFKTQVNERQDGTQEIITRTSDDVEYVVIDGKIVRTYITKTVIDLETGEEKTVRVWIVAAEENGENEDDVSVNAYDKNGVGSKLKKAEKKNGKKLEFDKIPGNGKNELFDKNRNNGNKLSPETGKKEVI